MSLALLQPRAAGAALFQCQRCSGPARWPTRLSPGQRLHGLCDNCADKAVLHPAQLDEAYHWVSQFLACHLKLHLSPWLKRSDVHLVPPSQWTDAEGHTHTLGLARTQVQPMPHGQPPRLLKAEVYVLLGLSFINTAGVLAHEAFHVYSAAQGLSLDRAREEGSANLWQYLFLTVHPGSAQAEELRCQMLQDPDAIYGQGFREARLAYKQAAGFGAYVAGLRS